MKTKQTIVGILWAIGIIMMVKSGPLDPGAVTYAGFTLGLTLCWLHGGGVFRSICVGMLSMIAALGAVGVIIMPEMGQKLFLGVVGFLCYTMAVIIGKWGSRRAESH